jgi:hypothetical protein
MVISKSAYDLAGMSTDRRWRSCMNLRDGINRHFVPVDIKHGTLVSYLVNPTDKNIEKPMGRILIKPYVEIDNQDEVLYGIEHDKVKYGRDNPEYVKTLVNVLDKAQEEKTGIFRLDGNLYPDAGKQFTVSNSKEVPPERILKYFAIKNYTINKDGTVDVNGDVNLSLRGLTEIPIKFGVVRGKFDVRFNNLLSLKNSPREVTGTFDCSGNNNLTSLKYGPKIAGTYKCNFCNLQSSEGMPTKVTETFDAEDQYSGYFFPEEKLEALIPNYSILKNLTKYNINNYAINEDGTVDVDGNVHLAGNKLTKIPIKFGKIKGDFNVSVNHLISLENSPREVTGTFNCSGNEKLTSLKGGPSSAYIYDCSNCKLTSLEGSPTGYIPLLICKNNPNLSSLKGGPEKVRIIDCNSCNLTSLEDAPKEAEYFYCSKQVSGRKFKIADVRAVCDVKHEIHV